MEILAVRTPLVAPRQDLLGVLVESLEHPLREREVLCVVSKVVALEQGRLVALSKGKDSAQALSPPSQQAGLVELLQQEADAVLGRSDGAFYLTLKDGLLVVNAGIDRSNVPDGYAVLWPRDPWTWARRFWERLRNQYGLRELGVVVTDSHLTPLRRGVTGIAVAWAGFEGIDSQIGAPDLYGAPLAVTEKAVADDLASASVLLTGEAGECTPFALVRNAPLTFTDREIDPREPSIDPQIDLFSPLLSDEVKALLASIDS